MPAESAVPAIMRGDAEFDAEAALHQIAQHQGRADHQHAGRRHQAWRHRQQARPHRSADSADIADHPVGRRNGQAEQDQKDSAFDVPAQFIGHWWVGRG